MHDPPGAVHVVVAREVVWLGFVSDLFENQIRQRIGVELKAAPIVGKYQGSARLKVLYRQFQKVHVVSLDVERGIHLLWSGKANRCNRPE